MSFHILMSISIPLTLLYPNKEDKNKRKEKKERIVETRDAKYVIYFV